MHPTGEWFDVVVIGGGPAGSALGRLIAAWGHRVAILDRPREAERGLAESIPPSARKLLAAVGVLDAVHAAGFVPNRGNAVWWGSADGRTEDFDGADLGFQVYRPRFDAVLLDEAVRAGADVRRGAIAHAVALEPEAAHVTAAHDGQRIRISGRFVVDCSGRAGVLARRGYRVYEPRHRMQAFVGLWRRAGGFPPDAEDRTVIETYDDGWAWSLPLDDGVRQIAVMVDGTTTVTSRGPTFAHTYRAELAKTRQLRVLADGAVLERAWACDASMHVAHACAGPQFLLVGDAATCIDPLSSFGVKKALSSAWLGAVALHTALVDERRRAVAFDFFAAREREVYAAELARTEAFAQRAFVHHHHPFWGVRGADPQPAPPPTVVDACLRGEAVRAAHAWLREAASLSLRWRQGIAPVRAPRVHGREIVLDPALPIGAEAVRYAAGVDLIALGELVARHSGVPAIHDAYTRAHGAVPLPSLLAALALLVAEGLLE